MKREKERTSVSDYDLFICKYKNCLHQNRSHLTRHFCTFSSSHLVSSCLMILLLQEHQKKIMFIFSSGPSRESLLRNTHPLLFDLLALISLFSSLFPISKFQRTLIVFWICACVPCMSRSAFVCYHFIWYDMNAISYILWSYYGAEMTISKWFVLRFRAICVAKFQQQQQKVKQNA